MSAKTYLVRFGSDNPATYTGLTPTFTKFFNSAGTATTAPSISEIASSGMFSFSYTPNGFIGFVLDGTASMATSIRYLAGVLDPNDMVVDTGVSLIAVGVSLSAMGASLNAQGNTISVIGFSLGIMGNSLSVFGSSMAIMGNSLIAQGNTVASLGVFGTSLIAMGDSQLAQGVTLAGIGTSLAALGVSFRAGASLIGSAADSYGTSAVDPTTLFGFMKRLQEVQEGDSTFAKGTGVWTIYDRGSSYTLASKTIADSTTSVTKV